MRLARSTHLPTAHPPRHSHDPFLFIDKPYHLTSDVSELPAHLLAMMERSVIKLGPFVHFAIVMVAHTILVDVLPP